MGEKNNFLSQEDKLLNIANGYLKNGMFEMAKVKFLELKDSIEYYRVVPFALKLCEYQIRTVIVEESVSFFEKMRDVAVQKNDVLLYKDVSRLLSENKNEFFNLQELITDILKKFNLSRSLEFSELKSFIYDFKTSYLYYDVLDSIITGYITDKKFDEAIYFIEEGRELKPKDHKMMFNYILWKTRCSNEKELIQCSMKLTDIPEFNELLMLCESEEQAEKYIKLSADQNNKNQREYYFRQSQFDSKDDEDNSILDFDLEKLPWIVKLILVLMTGIYGNIVRMFRSAKKGNTVGVVIALILLCSGGFGILWIIDIVCVIFNIPIWWID